MTIRMIGSALTSQGPDQDRTLIYEEHLADCLDQVIVSFLDGAACGCGGLA